jgi:hypothetical protein
MVNRPDSSSTRSDKSSSSRSSMNKSSLNTRTSFVRSKSGNDYNEKNGTVGGKLRNSSSLQSIAKSSGNQSTRGMRKFKSNGRFVDDCLIIVMKVNRKKSFIARRFTSCLLTIVTTIMFMFIEQKYSD